MIQLLPNQNILDCLHRSLEQVCIRGSSVVYVYLSVDTLVDRPELIGKELCCGVLITLPTMVIREVSFDRGILQLLPKQVNLVQEQDNWFVLEPFAVDKTCKEHECFVHLIGVDVFE